MPDYNPPARPFLIPQHFAPERRSLCGGQVEAAYRYECEFQCWVKVWHLSRETYG
jgi:hypothetical protein